MKKLIYVSLVIVAVLLGLTFTYLNQQTVQIKYLSFEADVVLPVLILIVFAVGAIFGYLTCLISVLKLRRRVSVLKKEIKLAAAVNQ